MQQLTLPAAGLVATSIATSLVAQTIAPPVPGNVPITPTINQSAGPPGPNGGTFGGNMFNNTKGNLVRFQLGHIDPLAVEQSTGVFLLAPNNAGQRVVVIHVPSKSIMTEIPTGPGITSIKDRPGTFEAWCVDSVNHCVSVIDPVKQRVMRTIAVGKEPYGIAFKPDGTRAYVTCSASGQVDVIDCTLTIPAVVNTIPIPDAVAPRGIVVHNNTVWVTPLFSGNNTTAKKTDPAGGFASSQVVKQPTGPGEIPLPDKDLFGIPITGSPTTDVLNPSLTQTGLGTILLNVHARPGTNELWIPNTEALNTVVGEANIIGGKAVSNRITIVDTTGAAAPFVLDLDAMVSGGAAQPSSIAFSGTHAYVACFGSDRILAINLATKALTNQVVLTPLTPPLGSSPARCGPRGLSLAPSGSELYVFNGIDNSYSTIDLSTFTVGVAETIGYDPTPANIKRGMGHLANANHSLSNTTSCMSCHVDGHVDMLTWDLSAFLDPPGTANPIFEHDNKGPMATQSLRGLFEAGVMHWRGEQVELEAFNEGGFVNLMKRPTPLSAADFEEVAAAVFSLVYPSNPRGPADRVFDATQQRGEDLFRTANAVGFSCAQCHLLPLGTNAEIQPFLPTAQPSTSGKVGQLRGVQDKLGPTWTVFPGVTAPEPSGRTVNGWGLNHSATIPNLTEFVNNFPGLSPFPAQVAAVVAYTEAFDTGLAVATTFQRTLNYTDFTTHAAAVAAFDAALNEIKALAVAGHCDIVVAGSAEFGGLYYPYTLAWDHQLNLWQSSTAGAAFTDTQLRQFTFEAGNSLNLSFFGQPLGTGARFGTDRDLDGLLNDNEAPNGMSPTNPDSDGDGIPDGHEVKYPSTPDTTPPKQTSALTVVYRTSTTAKIEFSTDEPTRAEVVIASGDPYRALNSPMAGGYDLNHSIHLRSLTEGKTESITILITDVAGNPITRTVSVTAFGIADGIRITKITAGPLNTSTGTITVDVSADRYLSPGAPLAAACDLEIFAYAEGLGVPLMNATIPATNTIPASSNTVSVPVTIPASVLSAGSRKLHFGVRFASGGVVYIEGKDVVNFLTVNF